MFRDCYSSKMADKLMSRGKQSRVCKTSIERCATDVDSLEIKV